MIWTTVKERLGVSNFSLVLFYISSFLQPIVDLSSLVLPFDKQEIDLVVVTSQKFTFKNHSH
jgi:hypothetical protein